MPAAEQGTREQLAATLRDLLGPRRGLLLGGAALAVVLLPFDLGRQLLVRQDPSRLAALLVDVVGFVMAGIGQLMFAGALLAGRGWLRSGVLATATALRRQPVTLVSGLAAAGGVSALVTLPASVAALGLGQVVGPLDGPSLGALSVATASDALATALTAPYFALLVSRLTR